MILRSQPLLYHNLDLWTTSQVDRQERLCDNVRGIEGSYLYVNPDGGGVLSARKRPVRVLYIEDREEIRRVFAGLMRLGVDIETEILLASDGREGVEMALQEKPDIIFVDSIMPVMDGIEATRCLKAEESLKDVPVIMISAHVDLVERQEEAEEAGVAFFIDKPFTSEELESAMRRVLGL